MATTVRSRKAKGMRFQKQIAETIQRIFKLKPADVKPAISGETGRDIHLSTYAEKRVPLAIECKNVEKLNVWSAIEQAKSNEKEGLKWCVFFKKNHSDTYAIVDAEWLLEILNHVTSPNGK